LSKSIGQSIDYQIVTNERIKDHEKLFYQLTVIKDQFPIISASYARTV
jgi:preprotein translocase subunit SecD